MSKRASKLIDAGMDEKAADQQIAAQIGYGFQKALVDTLTCLKIDTDAFFNCLSLSSARNRTSHVKAKGTQQLLNLVTPVVREISNDAQSTLHAVQPDALLMLQHLATLVRAREFVLLSLTFHARTWMNRRRSSYRSDPSSAMHGLC
jgi:hypothetical protein